MRRTMIVAAMLAATAAAAQEAPRQRVEAPPQVSGRCAVVPMLAAAIPVVNVMIGGKGPYRFAIDTGAAGHGRIKPELATALGLAVMGDVGAPAPGGTVATRRIFDAPELSVGGLVFRDINLVELSALRGPNSDWDGILGIALFQKLALTLDYGNAGVRLGGAGLATGSPLTFDRTIPVLPVTIAGKSFQVDLDSGNGAGALFLSEADATALPLAGPAVERGRARTSFAEFAIMEAPLAVPVMAGETALPVKAVGWPSARPGGNLGSKGLAGMAVTLDVAGAKIDIRPSGAPLTCPA